MIAKRILRPKAASNFARLGAYLLSEKTGLEGDASSLTFGYIALEAERQELTLGPGGGPPPSPAFFQFIFEQNTMAHIQSPGYIVRAFSPKDAGQALYHGLESLKDGSQILLLRKEDVMLAKPATPEESAKDQTLPKGSVLTLNRTGKIEARSRA